MDPVCKEFIHLFMFMWIGKYAEKLFMYIYKKNFNLN